MRKRRKEDLSHEHLVASERDFKLRHNLNVVDPSIGCRHVRADLLLRRVVRWSRNHRDTVWWRSFGPVSKPKRFTPFTHDASTEIFRNFAETPWVCRKHLVGFSRTERKAFRKRGQKQCRVYRGTSQREDTFLAKKTPFAFSTIQKNFFGLLQ